MVDVAANAASLMTLPGTVAPSSQARMPIGDPFSAAFAAAVVQAAATPGAEQASLPTGDTALTDDAAQQAPALGMTPGTAPRIALPVIAARQELAAAPVAVLPDVPAVTDPDVALLPVAKPDVAGPAVTSPLPRDRIGKGRTEAKADDERTAPHEDKPAAPGEVTQPSALALAAPASAVAVSLRPAGQVPSPSAQSRATADAAPTAGANVRFVARPIAAQAAVAREAPVPTAINQPVAARGQTADATAAKGLVPADLGLTLEPGPTPRTVAAASTPAPPDATAQAEAPVAMASTSPTPIAATPDDRPQSPRAAAAPLQDALVRPTPPERMRADRGKSASADIAPVADAALAAAPAAAHAAQPVETGREATAASPRPAPQRVDVATLVDTIARARDDAASLAPVAVALTHAEFGKVSLRFRNEDDGLAVSMSSADPGFAPAVAAAGQAQAAPDLRQQPQPQQDAPRGDAQGRSNDARADMNGASGQSASNGGRRQDSPRATSTPSQRGNARSSGESPQQRDGIFA
ncbi:hypothetical protein [Novosphingobium sp.]|uniref:hypothetical protein n=1 Tax=Novosphingobium sp. TaxID=1874826 RepID=UPI0038BC35B8